MDSALNVRMRILVLNAGSSSLKYGLFETAGGENSPSDIAISRLSSGVLRLGGSSEAQSHREAVERLVAQWAEPSGGAALPDVVGHRVVHGGTRFRSPVRLDEDVLVELRELSALAPLHNPPALLGIDAVRRAWPGVLQIAAFDTAFFATLPPHAYLYPVPYAWFEDWGLRRFGFHGLSHSGAAARARELLPGIAAPRIITCHVGNGVSATAVANGQAIATTMGFTPLDGLMMGSRSGAVDPGLLLHVMKSHGLSGDEVDRVLHRESGLLGISGISSDYRVVESAAKVGDPRARLALRMYSDRVRTAIGGLAATLGGCDALVFTGGVGENSSGFRSEVCQGLDCLGLRLDPTRNSECQGEGDVAASGPGGRILIVKAQEELVIAREAFRLLSRQSSCEGVSS